MKKCLLLIIISLMLVLLPTNFVLSDDGLTSDYDNETCLVRYHGSKEISSLTHNYFDLKGHVPKDTDVKVSFDVKLGEDTQEFLVVVSTFAVKCAIAIPGSHDVSRGYVRISKNGLGFITYTCGDGLEKEKVSVSEDFETGYCHVEFTFRSSSDNNVNNHFLKFQSTGWTSILDNVKMIVSEESLIIDNQEVDLTGGLFK